MTLLRTSRFVGQAAEDRIKAVSDFGFTQRQARFLETVMLNGGVCVPRQYAQFVGTAYGQNVNAFFDKLVDQGLAVKCPCVHNRARVYQLRHQALYQAVGEPNSPNRKPIAAGRRVRSHEKARRPNRQSSGQRDCGTGARG